MKTERIININRKTRETSIEVTLNLSQKGQEIQTKLPFFDHLLSSMSFHGDFFLKITANGDIDVDPHHLVEDTGIVLGSALNKIRKDYGAVCRFGHSVIPMDDALSEIAIDVCGRAYCHYEVNFPQQYAGNFDLSLLREFFTGLAGKALISIHILGRSGLNSHHMAESIFKALGKSINQAYKAVDSPAGEMSTKGLL